MSDAMNLPFQNDLPGARAALVLAAALLATASLAAADADVIGSGHVVSETRAVSGFHGVELKGSGTVIVTQGDTEGLVIDAEDNLLPLLESTVDPDGILHLGFKKHAGSVEFKKPLTFKLAVKTLEKVVIAGSGDLRAGSLSAEGFDIALPGSGNVVVDHLKTGTVHTEINGSGDVKLAGEAHSQRVNINGSGDYKARALKTGDATVAINGSGDGEVWADESLSVAINGSGEVGYAGHPAIQKNVHGSGEVHPLDGKED